MNYQEEFLVFLSSLESSVASGKSGLSDRNFVLLIYHLREVNSIFEKTVESTSTWKRENSLQESVGAGITVHDPLTSQTRMKLMDLGRISLSDLSYDRNEVKISLC